MQMAHLRVGGRQWAWDRSRRDVRPAVDTSGSPLPGAAHPLPTLPAPAAAGRAPPPTSQHHTNRQPLTTTNGPNEQEWCPSAPHNFDATWSWPGACWHSTRSSLPPCLPALRAPQERSSWPLHSRYAGCGFGRLVKAACQAGGLGLVRAHLCIKRPPGRAAATIAPGMVQTYWSEKVFMIRKS